MTQAVRPAARYGDDVLRGRRRATVIAWTVVAAALMGVLVWIARAHADPPVSGQLLDYSHRTEHSVSVTISVHQRAGGPAVCRLRALGPDHSVVGTSEVALKPSAHGARSTLTVVIPTRSRPVNGELIGCVAG